MFFADDEDTGSEGTLVDEYQTKHQEPIKSQPILSKQLVQSHDDFMYRTDYDNRIKLNTDSFQTNSFQTTASSSMVSFVENTSSKPQSQQTGTRTTSINQKSSTPVKTPPSPLFQRIQTQDSKPSLQFNDQYAAVHTEQRKPHAEHTPQAPPRRSITSQEIHTQNTESKKLVQNHFGVPKNEQKSKASEATPRAEVSPKITNKPAPEKKLTQVNQK
jgi:hypothetical protein